MRSLCLGIYHLLHVSAGLGLDHEIGVVVPDNSGNDEGIANDLLDSDHLTKCNPATNASQDAFHLTNELLCHRANLLHDQQTTEVEDDGRHAGCYNSHDDVWLIEILPREETLSCQRPTEHDDTG